MSVDTADTGEIIRDLGDKTRVIGDDVRPITYRRPGATGEFPFVTPAPAPAPADDGGEVGSVRRSVPYELPEGWTWDGSRHRRPGLFLRWFGGPR